MNRGLPIAIALIVAACGSAATPDWTPGPFTPGASSPAASSPAASSPAPIASRSAGPSPSATAGPTPRPSATARPSSSATTAPRATLVPLVRGLSSPLLAMPADDGSDRVFVVEQRGLVKVVRDGLVARTPFLDVRDKVSCCGERGLLGLAFHPRFPADPRIFVDYTDRDGETVVAAFTVGDGGRAATVDPATERILLRIRQPYSNHNGGHLAFGPDGMLYVGMGDGGSGGDPEGYGQRLDTLLGKLLRIDVDRSVGDRPYAIPSDNPFAGGGGRPEIWALGLRNPWRFSFDPVTGDLWVGDVGQGRLEEVSVIRAGRPAPANLGWNRMEGDRCFEPETGCDRAGLTLPVAVYGHGSDCSVTGGPVARGAAAGSLAGRYLFGDYCSGTIRWIDAAVTRLTLPKVLLETGRRIVSFGRTEAGAILVVDIDGEILELRPR